MSNIRGISSGKKPPEKPPLCPYCYVAPASEHPAFTCPDIQAVAFDEECPGWFEVTFRRERTPPETPPTGDETP